MGLIIFLLCLLLYFLPSIIGWGKKNADSIFLLNLFLGWTFVGWVVSLVWATSKDTQPVKIIQNNTSDSANLDKLLKLKQLLDSNALTQEEYDREKKKILEGK